MSKPTIPTWRERADQNERMIQEIAANEVVKADRRPWTITPYMQVRKAHEADSLTNAISRYMVDAADAFDGLPGDLTEWVEKVSPELYREVKTAAHQRAEQDHAASQQGSGSYSAGNTGSTGYSNTSSTGNVSGEPTNG